MAFSRHFIGYIETVRRTNLVKQTCSSVTIKIKIMINEKVAISFNIIFSTNSNINKLYDGRRAFLAFRCLLATDSISITYCNMFVLMSCCEENN